MKNEEIKAILRLFKGVLTEDLEQTFSEEAQQNVLSKCLSAGITFDSYLVSVPDEVIDEAINMYGIDKEKWNQTFHKSFSTVRDTPIETLIAQQIIHYFTTYGLEALGLYNKDLVYIPHEELEIPDLNQDIPLTVIHKYSHEELAAKLMVLLTSGIALSKTTIEDIMTLSDYIPKDRFDEIKNREIKIALYDLYNVVPKDPIEFLRYLIYKTTGSTLLIKSNSMIQTIKRADIEKPYQYISSYVSNSNGYIELASIFLRYKDIILAFKRDKSTNKYGEAINKIINKLGKLSKTYHSPLKANILNELTQISTSKELEEVQSEILAELDKATIFREVRILNAIKYRLSGNENIVYKIRNGKGYVKVLNTKSTEFKTKAQHKLYEIIKTHLAKRLSPMVSGKTIYIPDYINYTVPTTEKQFIGNIPQGSYIEIPKDNNMVIGVHWCNLYDNDDYYNGGRVDLDLHMQNRDEQYGWNTSYRAESSDLYYSGDVTDAKLPEGATELFFVGRNCFNKAFLLTLNKFTRNNAVVPYEIVIAKAGDDKIDKDYVIDPNDIMIQIPQEFEYDLQISTSNQKTLGLVKVADTIKFYFDDFQLGDSIVTRQNNVTRGAYDYLQTYSDIQLKLKDILILAGATLTNTAEHEELEEVTVSYGPELPTETLYRKVLVKPDIDLSLESISKETLIKLMIGE